MASENKGKSVAQRNRALRQEALREQLVAGGHLQHVVDMANKLSDLDIEIDSTETQRMRAAIDAKLKLVNKYLPDLRSTEITGEGGGDATLVTKIELVGFGNGKS